VRYHQVVGDVDRLSRAFSFGIYFPVLDVIFNQELMYGDDSFTKIGRGRGARERQRSA
jgi:hypothetical protein